MVHRAQAGHPGGSLSEIDLMAALYSTSLRVRPDDPDWEDRDRFVLSKGHASPGMYALLAEKGFISHDDLHSYRVLGGICQGIKQTTRIPSSPGPGELPLKEHESARAQCSYDFAP